MTTRRVRAYLAPPVLPERPAGGIMQQWRTR
jgi:hypothetical protein